MKRHVCAGAGFLALLAGLGLGSAWLDREAAEPARLEFALYLRSAVLARYLGDVQASGADRTARQHLVHRVLPSESYYVHEIKWFHRWDIKIL